MSTTGVISSRLFESSYNVPCGCHDNENVEAESESLADSFLNSDDEAYDPEEFKRLCVMDYSSVMEVMTAREHKERTAPESIFIPNSTFPDCSVDALERSFRGIAPEPAPTSTVEGSGGVGSIQRVDPNTQGLIGHPQSGTHTGDAQATVGGASTGEQVDTSPKGKEKAIVVSDLDEWDEPDTQMFHSQKHTAYHNSSPTVGGASTGEQVNTSPKGQKESHSSE
ncbi:hypothetical protein SARC_09755 [Sphaeroforma arctica JP610]|uniref:Uncharacterized protein n=1 Tax=Sphaeroforma arctica JP610 TaxID=667725 RepID=A0A0L0FLY6_9EUKA|nr:hypothetical protein SARC_09755 [Sphaeroforma arctica JP610]KNC77792.1 hypothetical protein SARC_09755 [Sphaeroforma arctica JP610]|eukprot:XP_014151694.1 hypothetical protein SARC_09755 [Sphaeroforma arctica JP610]